MIKAILNNRLFLGLSDENMKRLSQDQPIKFNLKEIGMMDLEIVIFNGKTEQEMKTMMLRAGLIDPEKTIIQDSNADKN